MSTTMTKGMTSEKWSVSATGDQGLKDVLEATCTRRMRTCTMLDDGDGVYTISDITGNTVTLTKARTGETITEDLSDDDMLAANECRTICGGLVFRANRVNYYLTEVCMFTLTEKLGISVDTLLLTCAHTELADLISLVLEKKKRALNFVYTKGDQIHRLFACGSEMFLPLGGDVIYKFIKEIASGPMGDYEVESVTSDQRITEIRLAFPNVSAATNGATCDEVYNRIGFTPKVVIRTSDHGYSSFVVKAIWSKKGFDFIAHEKARNHKQRHKDAQSAIDKLMKDMERSIFPAFTKLLPRLDDLSDMIVTMGGSDAKGRYIDYITDLFHAVKLDKAIGARRQKRFIELLLGITDFDMPLTACDVILGIIDAAEHIDGLEGSHLNDFKKAIGDIPYAKVKPQELALTA